MKCTLTFNAQAQLLLGFPRVHSDLQGADVTLDW